jgi:hypothetical protein
VAQGRRPHAVGDSSQSAGFDADVSLVDQIEPERQRQCGLNVVRLLEVGGLRGQAVSLRPELADSFGFGRSLIRARPDD